MAEPATVAAALSGAAVGIVKKALDGFGERLSKKIGKITRSTLDKMIVEFKIGFDQYLTATYNKCAYFKTILNPNQPLAIESNYIHVSLTCAREEFEDTDLIKSVDSRKSIVITGLAGSGKSMLMKYLTISKFKDEKGVLPLFVELRHLNPLTERNLLTFVRGSCTSQSSSITEEQFKLSLKTGALMLILDGFDELNHEIRNDIAKQILDIKKDYPEAIVVVSSRPDERFGSWTHFFVFKVRELSKAQTLKLIEGLDYDNGVKRRFLREVAVRLYDSHTSFLSYPLLCTIMLLTYEEFAEIPDKMHAFYSQAFDTLFQKHDAQKDQFQRKTRTGLSREEFKVCLSAFSAISYLEERFSFDSDKLAVTAKNALDYARQKMAGISKDVTPSQFVDDLREFVCMLQQDGLNTIFVHRSFQEYFAAAFAVSLHGAKIRKVIDKFSLRPADSVIAMAHDMDPEAIEQEWVLPTIKDLQELFELDDSQRSTAVNYAKAITQLVVFRRNDTIYIEPGDLRIEVIGPLEVLGRLYTRKLSLQHFALFKELSLDRARALWTRDREGSTNPDRKFAPIFGEPTDKTRRYKVIRIKIKADDDWWLCGIGVDKYFVTMRRNFSSIRRDIEGREKKRTDILADFV